MSAGTSALNSLASSPSSPSPIPPSTPSSSRQRDPIQRALEGIRTFLESKTCYEILPESFRLIVFDNKLSITRSLQALVTNGVVSAPLYDSTTQRFAGMFVLADVVHLIQYYYQTCNESEYESVVAEVESFQLGSLRKIEQAIDVPPPPTIFVHPEQPLADACAALVRTHARRLPLVDTDMQTGKETIVSVLTQYRVLKFIAINCQHDCARLDQSIGQLGVGSYVSGYSFDGASPTPNNFTTPLPSNTATPTSSSTPTPASSSPPLASSTISSLPLPSSSAARSRARSVSQLDTNLGSSDKYFPLATASLETSVFDVVHVFSERGISAVPIVDEDGVVLNMYETVDIVDLVRQNAYQVLQENIGVALQQRAPDFTGVITCTPHETLASILAYIRERRCHRFVIVEGEDSKSGRKKGSLVGILSLSDVLRYLVGHEDLKGHEVPGLSVMGLRGGLAAAAAEDATSGGGGGGDNVSAAGSRRSSAGSVDAPPSHPYGATVATEVAAVPSLGEVREGVAMD